MKCWCLQIFISIHIMLLAWSVHSLLMLSATLLYVTSFAFISARYSSNCMCRSAWSDMLFTYMYFVFMHTMTSMYVAPQIDGVNGPMTSALMSVPGPFGLSVCGLLVFLVLFFEFFPLWQCLHSFFLPNFVYICCFV